jgi:hypothetical protein
MRMHTAAVAAAAARRFRHTFQASGKSGHLHERHVQMAVPQRSIISQVSKVPCGDDNPRLWVFWESNFKLPAHTAGPQKGSAVLHPDGPVWFIILLVCHPRQPEPGPQTRLRASVTGRLCQRVPWAFTSRLSIALLRQWPSGCIARRLSFRRRACLARGRPRAVLRCADHSRKLTPMPTLSTSHGSTGTEHPRG